MDRLLAGYRNFRTNYYPTHRDLFNTLAGGQSPRAMIVACGDSRVDPNLLLSAEPGSLFSVRNVASLIPPYVPDGQPHSTSAALEFAVCALQVPHVVIMGHSSCGGVRALLSQDFAQPDETDFIGHWMHVAAEARRRALARNPNAGPDQIQRHCEHETIKLSLANALTFPWLRQRVDEGLLMLHGWWFEIETGQILALDRRSGQFLPLLEVAQVLRLDQRQGETVAGCSCCG